MLTAIKFIIFSAGFLGWLFFNNNFVFAATLVRPASSVIAAPVAKPAPAPVKIVAVKKSIAKPALNKSASKSAALPRLAITPATSSLYYRAGGALKGPLSLIKQEYNLSTSGIIYYTDEARLKNGITIKLVPASALQILAEQRLLDMFSREYFSHNSPEGVTPAQLVKQGGYNYLYFGENIAKGDFKSNKALVDAWLASPGHRANILSKKYKEIGVAVGEGIYDGVYTRIAVQEFGAPRNYCPALDENLKQQVVNDKTQLEFLQQGAVTMKADLAVYAVSSDFSSTEYNFRVMVYNQLVAQINDTIGEIKSLTAAFNQQVADFNNCLKNL